MVSAVKYVKTYVDVLVKMRTDGTFIPVKVLWDEREFDVDSVVKITMSPPQFVGSSSTIKYLVKLCGQERALYLEDNPRRWFIEKPVVQFV